MFENSPLKLTPVAPAASQIVSGNQRITLLTDGLIRFETGKDGKFEDRASTFAINRDLPTPKFDVLHKDGGAMEIVTDRVFIQWNGQPFGPSSLLVSLRKKGGTNMGWTNVWRYGDSSNYKLSNLGGTARTLDLIDGRCPLENGILSQYGLAILDDTGSMLFTEDGWVAPRDKSTDDVYLFAYGLDYRESLRAFYTVSGRPSLIPRYSLGNWWSRYAIYSSEEYLALMDRFREDGIPLNIGILDIDWHKTKVEQDYGTGWTGYTWDKDLFPDTKAFLQALKDRNLVTALNMHPADGVRKFEEPYEAMSKALGRDPSTGVPIPFECTNKEFLERYFTDLHHPLEDEVPGSMPFQWIDWQQGPHSEVEGIDPLWVLNHFHWIDSGRNGARRFTFSRFAGPGSHRYPCGFSGDTVISWKSLDFQAEFTSTASNVGFNSWSNDIGGHYHGIKDDELQARWVQQGCFSPFLRLHSSISPFNTREPWAFSRETHDVQRTFMQFRHRLVPYIYSASVDSTRNFKALVEPMYYDYAAVDEAYKFRTQYTFGTELLVIPVVSPKEKSTAMGKATGWLPKGLWVDIFNQTVYDGDRVISFHRELHEYPVLAKQGAIVPLDGKTGAELENGCPIPTSIEILLVVGADGKFDLVEDDGSGADYDDVKFSTTPIRYSQANGTLNIGPTEGEKLLENRSYSVRLLAASPSDTTLEVDGSVIIPPPSDEEGLIHLGSHSTSSTITLSLGADMQLAKRDPKPHIFERLSKAQMGIDEKGLIWDAVQKLEADGVIKVISRIKAIGAGDEIVSAVEELLLADLRQ